LVWTFQYAAVHGLRIVANALPRATALFLARMAARLMWLLLPKRRRIARKQAVRALGDGGARVAAASFRHLLEALLLIIRFPRERRGARWAARFDFVGLDRFERAMAMGKGVIAVSGHFGVWEAFNAEMARRGHRVCVVRRAMDNGWLNVSFDRFWRKVGTEAIWREGAIRECERVLQAGGILTMYVDQDARRSGLMVPFLGQEASTIRGPAVLALRTGAPILGYAVTRLPGDRFRVEFDEPFLADTAIPQQDALHRATLRLTADFERHVRSAPEQWMWIHRRWKTKKGETRRDTSVLVEPEKAHEAPHEA
jgi:KDO2-lipid IV(A) lauroyltransferase